MALADSENTEKKTDPHKKEKLLSKVVVRRLPPTMNRETFLNQISPVPSYDYFYMVKGDASLGENSFSRAYINFSNPNDIYDFKEKFDNYVFLDAVGHEFPAVVEFAAFQKIPKRRTKIRIDPKVGSIESDPYYLEFVEMVNKPPEYDEKPEYTYQITSENKNSEITPLLQFLKNRKAEKIRIREERREERKRKEFERKKFRDDERKKRYDERSPTKSSKPPYVKTVSPKEKSLEKEDKPEVEDELPEKEEVEVKPSTSSTSSFYKNREKKYEDRKRDIRPKYYPKKEYVDKREYKNRRDDYKERDYRPKYEEYKKDDPKVYQKKVKKYSEKREERKIEAQKAEQKKLEQEKQQNQEEPSKAKMEEQNFFQDVTGEDAKRDEKCKETDAQAQKRIRNKDRPTIAIYRPGMLSKRRQTDGESDSKDIK